MNAISLNWWRVTIFLSFLITYCASDENLVSQISPKSTDFHDPHVIVSSMAASITELEEMPIVEEDSEQHNRIERSALPILNDVPDKSNMDPINQKEAADTNEVANSGRYFNYNIKPTSTLSRLLQKAEITRSQRMAKNLEKGSFLLNGGLRSLTLGSPIKPTNVMQTSEAVMATRSSLFDNKPRQNANPDIQDIITGIVKLLNGNVNVHANTQGLRRPSASRINNRGPPRISEAQPLPMDYDIQKPQILQPPFPFDRPLDTQSRPFMTGVPIPEQIIPTMQQPTNNNNYRPNFISQNRPPWHRPRPRPPINGNRRPIPPYKPMLAMEEHHSDDSIAQYTTIESDNNNNNDETHEMVAPTDVTVNNDLSDEIENDSVYYVSSTSTSTEPILSTTLEVPMKKDEHIKKKDNKNKSGEKKSSALPPPIPQATATDDLMMTIIHSTSEVNLAQAVSSTPLMPTMSGEEDDSMSFEDSLNDDDIHFITTSRTPILEIIPSSSLPTSQSLPSSPPIISSSMYNTNGDESANDNNDISSAIEATPSIENIVDENKPTASQTPSSTASYHARPGIVLDDPEFKPGGVARPNRPQTTAQQPKPQQHLPPQIQPTRQHLPPGYGEIFDITLSAIQGPGNGSGGSKQTINIKPYGTYGGTGSGNGDIITSPAGDEGFVSIDGKRTYINLFGEPTDAPAGPEDTTSSTTLAPASSTTSQPHYHHTSHKQNRQPPPHQHQQQQQPNLGTGYAVPQSEIPEIKPTKVPQRTSTVQPTQIPVHQRPHYRPRTTQPPVRIDTCIVGDDSTCDQAQNEKCKTENGVSSCHCRPGYSRRKHREPCRRVVSFFMSLRVDKIYERRIVWDNKLLDRNSEHYGQLSYESTRAVDSAMSMTPFSDEFMDAKVNNIYHGDPSQGAAGVFVNLTMKLEENAATLRSNLRGDIQKHLLGVIHRRNNNIGNSVLYVESPAGSVSNLQDLDECQTRELNDCHVHASCTNIWGSFRCQCDKGFRDPWSDQPQRAGKECQSCPDAHCNNRGSCNYDADGAQTCVCEGNFYGSQCEIDGEVLGVAIGASVAAVIIIVLTLICLIMWSRRWHREQKNAIGSPVFGYMNTGPIVKQAGMGHPAYQVTLEDRMRWAQIADVMAQANHYGAEPVAPNTRPSSAMFAYPNLQAMGMGTMGGMSIHGTLPMHHQQSNNMPPVPLPRRLAISHRSNGMRTLENSSSSEEEDRADLIGRNFHVPRPKSRSNGSIANQSGIYYDVDYEPSGCDLYGGTTTTSVSTNQMPGPQGIPMSTYTSGRAPSTYYMK